MPSFKPKTLWPAEPHTFAKLAIIDRYLYTWFQIFGRTQKGRRLVYIDGFAGPGEYTNLPAGSPIVALNGAETVLADSRTTLCGQDLCFYFIEKEPWAAEHLHQKLSTRTFPKEIRWKVRQGAFEKHIADILTDVRREDPSVPIFAFLDPFGATGLPFWAVASILASPSCEVLLNLDSDGIARLMAADKIDRNIRHLDKLFGDSAWRGEIGQGISNQQLCARVLLAYKRRLRMLPNVRYSFAFTMNDQPGRLNYHLVFASQHSKGLEKMKEAMKRMDQSGDYTFADTLVGQATFKYDFDNVEPVARKMHAEFCGQTVALDEVRDYVLNETPFINPFPVLEFLRKRGLIERDCPGKPPTHGYPPGKVRAIHFVAMDKPGNPPGLAAELTFNF